MWLPGGAAASSKLSNSSVTRGGRFDSYFCQHHAKSFHFPLLEYLYESAEKLLYLHDKEPLLVRSIIGRLWYLLWGRKQSITAQFTVHNSPSCHQPTVGSLTPSLDCIVKVSPSTEQLTAARCCLAGGEGWMSSWWQTGGWIPGKYGHNRHSAFNALIILLHLHNIKEINKLYESLFIIVYFAQSKQTKH